MDEGLKVVNCRKITYKTLRFDFDNGFSYIEKRANARLVDCYFAETRDLYPDGSVKDGEPHYFYSFDSSSPEKEVKSINCLTFDGFDRLYYIDDDGNVVKLNYRQESE